MAIDSVPGSVPSPRDYWQPGLVISDIVFCLKGQNRRVNGALAVEDIEDCGLPMIKRRLNNHMSQRNEPVHMLVDGNLRHRRVLAQPHLYITKHTDDCLLPAPDML
jgi:hypothetical protein